MASGTPDRFGIAYRPSLAHSLWASCDEVDVIEIIADNWFTASSRQLAALRTLARRFPTRVHGVGLGLASVHGVDLARVSALARVVDAVGGGVWSEHLAFVRAGGVELGHLCCPPRTLSTLDGLQRNLLQVRRIVGSLPALENIATLMQPPCSDFDEAEFVAMALRMSGAEMLLDLHNLHANAQNFDVDAVGYLDRIPLERVTMVHIAGGTTIAAAGASRVLDDHRHLVPEPVYALLEAVAERATHPIEVIVERDGPTPRWEVYMAELEHARRAVASGRARRRAVVDMAHRFAS